MKIHFVCSGNTYRSRLAEAYLNSKKIPGIQATSSGVRAHYNENGPLTVLAKRILEREGIFKYTAPSWTQTTPELLAESDMVIFMEDDPYAFCRDTIHTIPSNCHVWDIPDIYADISDEKTIQESEKTFEKIKEKIEDLVRNI